MEAAVIDRADDESEVTQSINLLGPGYLVVSIRHWRRGKDFTDRQAFHAILGERAGIESDLSVANGAGGLDGDGDTERGLLVPILDMVGPKSSFSCGDEDEEH